MAYDPNKEGESNDQASGQAGNPYASLTGESSARASLGAGQPQFTGSKPPPGATAMPGGDSGPSATGYVNFDRLYNANSGVAEREAGKLQTSAQQKAQTFRTGLTGAQAGFNQKVRAGTVQAPSEGAQGWGKYGAGVESAPVRTAGGNATAPQTNADVQAEIQAGASGKYSGPNSLSEDTDAYLKLAQEAADAQDYANALGGGNEGLQGLGFNQTDAALLGAAGRPGFADAAQKYGDTKGELERANAASVSTADAARKQSDDDAKAYQGLLDERAQADQAAKDKAKADADAVQAAIGAAGGTDPVGRGVKYPSFQHVTTNENGEAVWDTTFSPDQIEHQFGADQGFDVAKDPSKGLGQKLAEWFGVSPDDADWVVGSMTEQDFKGYQDAVRRGPDAMKKWLDGMISRRKK